MDVYTRASGTDRKKTMTDLRTGKILVVRNDRLGDFMLAYPALAALKESLPEATVCTLVPNYTRPMAEVCDWVDRVITDVPATSKHPLAETVKLLRAERFDAVISLFSTTRIAVAAFLARIPVRVAPRTKLAQVFNTDRVAQRRSRSEKPEYEYNVDLIWNFLDRYRLPRTGALPQPPFLSLARSEELRQAFCVKHGISANDSLVFLHAGSGGSARNLSLEQYADLVANLAFGDRSYTVVLSAGPGEVERAEALSTMLRHRRIPHVVYRSDAGLLSFAEHIQFADMFISGSTGPLHIAGALDVPTAAFYPRRKSATSLRWQTLNSPGRRLAFSPPKHAAEEDMGCIDVREAADAISRKFLRD